MLRWSTFGASGLGLEVLPIRRDVAAAGQAAECVAFAVVAGFASIGTIHGISVYDEAGARFGTLRHPAAWIGVHV